MDDDYDFNIGAGKTPKSTGVDGFPLPYQTGSYFNQDLSLNTSGRLLTPEQTAKLCKSRHFSTHDSAPEMKRRKSTVRHRGSVSDPAVMVSTSGAGPSSSRVTSHDHSSPRGTSSTVDEADHQTDGVDEGSNSDAESFTLKDRQNAINQTHPFGIRVWKPALYKKQRGVQRTAEHDIHQTPGGRVSYSLFVFNFVWTVLFGWWLAVIAIVCGAVCCILGSVSHGAVYGRVFFDLAPYLLYPFGKCVRLLQEEAYVDEDLGVGRSLSEFNEWQGGRLREPGLFFGPQSTQEAGRAFMEGRPSSILSQDETASLLGRDGQPTSTESPGRPKRRLFGRGEWTFSRVLFYTLFYIFFSPFLILVSGLCWLFVFTIPMGRVTFLLFNHLRQHPLALSFRAEPPGQLDDDESSTVLVCTYRAVGIQYWKYTVDGTNIFLINLLALVVFAMVDHYFLAETLHLDSFITDPLFIFIISIMSTIPLAYFIGQAVASISAQSSMGVGATVNAFFSTVVEVFLYCVALNEGKGRLVEGSIIGSIFAGILLLPGVSMCFGALKRKTQRFNVKSASVTSTMLLFAVIGTFGPTLFYQMYGTHELNCHQCASTLEGDCRRCYFSQVPQVNDRFYLTAVKPYAVFSALMLFLSYIIGLFFTLRTHAAVIWTTDHDDRKHHHGPRSKHDGGNLASGPMTPYESERPHSAGLYRGSSHKHRAVSEQSALALAGGPVEPAANEQEQAGGHDAPNWSKTKSTAVLLSATCAYAIIAEILVTNVDGVLKNVDIDEKFLGITLFALVPTATEFLNAISFAMNGNIALSMEIGSAYALQVCLLQVPVLVFYSNFWPRLIDPAVYMDFAFTLIFPQWDMITVILCVFLLSYMYGEGKSNYFKGSILVFSYLVVLVGFYLSGYSNNIVLGINPRDRLAISDQVRMLGLADRLPARDGGSGFG